MADLLANWAMDTRRNKQLCLTEATLALESWSPLVAKAGGDIGYWMLSNMEGANEQDMVDVP
ncbi:hypothetical protein PF005_g32130 [Phytophthora fragariae]|uniref:Uncharacterized protein n=1 Tax=Phytophthora fragariae TaxID=53985 RepID=A0A6A4AUS4_9STRA|nr:hypothetical protein PF003_g34649 [Phytophthora fragariae]KAE8917270.1 hypothetical protein PF009_g32409 [Phytophthora fragariae]KAE8955169.1 hypothetical protein PF011_g31878 [Phytophthora fragariae]KAE9060311.1 hypothetical protein PF010_g30271 [Phytophthora fragariae]KAE9064597.1 hypothetical protein PF006_g30659 [Phytophthora fragariae]